MKKLILLFALIATPSYAQWNQDGKPVPDEPWRKSNGPFGVMLLLSDEPEKLMADWEKPETPQMSITNVATRGKPIIAFVFFVGCKPIDGRCQSTVDFTVLRPDGSVYGSSEGGELWKGKPAPSEKQIGLSVANFGIIIEPNDPAGTYTVKAVAHDLNAARSVEVQQVFTVSEKPAGK